MIVNKPHCLRTYLPQIITCIVVTFLLSDVGFSLSFPTVLVSALVGLNKKINPNETIHLTPIEVSWIGGAISLGKMVGGISCGFVSRCIGYRNALILVNLPQFVSFYLFYCSSSVWMIFVATFLLGAGCGFIKAPCSAYVTEISEAKVRGMLLAMSTISTVIAPLIIFVLANVTSWRNIALCWCLIQAVAAIALFCIPESPLFLLSKKRDKSALKSLRWLRGWVPQSAVQSEFDDIKRHYDLSNSCESCKLSKITCTHEIQTQTTWQAIKELFRKRSLKPYFILTVLCGVTAFTGSRQLIVYLVQILKAYRSPVNPNLGTVIVAGIGIFGTCVGLMALTMLGKRKLYISAAVGATLMNLILTIYGFVHLPPNSKSFEHHRHDLVINEEDALYIPLMAICGLRFCTAILLMVQFSMFGELYSFKARSLGTAATTGTNNILVFIAVKVFYDLEDCFDLPTTMGIYFAIGTLGLIVLYNILPETEGRTLEDIENHFSDNNKSLTEHKIKKQADYTW